MQNQKETKGIKLRMYNSNNNDILKPKRNQGSKESNRPHFTNNNNKQQQ